MTTPRPPHLHVDTLGLVAATALLWRTEGHSYATIIAKATFALRHGTEMAVVDPVAIVTADELNGSGPLSSVRRASECAPFLPAGEVLLSGHACAPRGKPILSHSVRLAMFRDNRPLVEKTLHVYGDSAGASRRPFDRMPLVYERTFGGRPSATNPVGVGFPEGSGVPNIVNPAAPNLPAGFGPLNAGWFPRAALIDEPYRPRMCDDGLEVPRGFPFVFGHAAPEDQRIEGYFRGDEWILLDGMHPDFPRMQSRLPSARVEARLIGALPGLEELFVPLALVADTLSMDADAMHCSVVWRGIVPLSSDARLPVVKVVVGIHLPGAPIEWPNIEKSESVPVDARTAGQTQALSPAQMDALAQLAPAPCAGPAAKDAAKPDPAIAALPVPEATSAPNAKTPQKTARAGETMALPEDFVAALGGMPFEKNSAMQNLPDASPPQRGSIPGAPWSREAAKAMPAPEAATVALDEVSSALAAAVVEPEKPVETTEPATKVEIEPVAPRRVEPEPPMAAPIATKPTRPAPPAKPKVPAVSTEVVKKGLYGKFGKGRS